MSLTGYRINLIQTGAVAILSNSNDNPMINIQTTNPSLIMDIEVLSENAATATVRQGATHSVPYYIGVIASADRSVVYWVNNTRPLP